MCVWSLLPSSAPDPAAMSSSWGPLPARLSQSPWSESLRAHNSFPLAALTSCLLLRWSNVSVMLSPSPSYQGCSRRLSGQPTLTLFNDIADLLKVMSFSLNWTFLYVSSVLLCAVFRVRGLVFCTFRAPLGVRPLSIRFFYSLLYPANATVTPVSHFILRIALWHRCYC